MPIKLYTCYFHMRRTIIILLITTSMILPISAIDDGVYGASWSVLSIADAAAAAGPASYASSWRPPACFSSQTSQSPIITIRHKYYNVNITSVVFTRLTCNLADFDINHECDTSTTVTYLAQNVQIKTNI